jgi:DNA-binding response OmpR family regulator
MGNTILIAEDDECLLKGLANYFAAAGFTVYKAVSSREAVELLYQHTPDCFLLDYHLSDDTAQLVCLSIRSNTPTKDAPIVILSGDERQGVASYESCQADSFILKGRGYAEALAAIKRHLRRVKAVKGLERRSDLTLDYTGSAVLPAGKHPVHITSEQFRFFAAIYEKRPRFVSEREMLARVFSIAGIAGTPDALNMLAHRLRIKLGPRLAKRIRHNKNTGWIYIEPRHNKPTSDNLTKTCPRS